MEWIKRCILWKNKYPMVLDNYYKDKKFVNPYVFIKFLSKNLKKDDIIIADDGGHLTWTLQAFDVKYGQKLFLLLGILRWVMRCQQVLEHQLQKIIVK